MTLLLFANVCSAQYIGGVSHILTNHSILLGTGTGIASLSVPASGTMLQGVASSDPTWTATPSLGVSATTAGTLTLYGGTSGSVQLKTAAVAGTGTIFQFPANNGTNTYVLQTDGSGVTSWVAASGGSSPIKTYTVTAADIDNTTTETDQLSVSIPANDWADGEEIEFDYWMYMKSNNSSTDYALRAYYSGNAGDHAITDVSLSNSFSEGCARFTVHFFRVGSDILVVQSDKASVENNSNAIGTATNTLAVGSAWTSGGCTIASQVFTSTATLKLTVQYYTATGTSTYVHARAARATKFSR